MYFAYSIIHQVSGFLSCWFHKVYLCLPTLQYVRLICYFGENIQDEGASSKNVLVGEIWKMLANTKHTFSGKLSVDLVTLLNVGTTDLKSSSHDQRHLPVG